MIKFLSSLRRWLAAWFVAIVGVIGGAMAAIVAFSSGAVWAHHSTTMYDHATTVTIEGTVKEVHWTNPHVSLFVEGTSATDQTPSVWLLEMTSPGNLARVSGWTRTSVKPGDKVTVEMSPMRDGTKAGALKKLTLKDGGKSFTTNIRAQERANLDEEPAK